MDIFLTNVLRFILLPIGIIFVVIMLVTAVEDLITWIRWRQWTKSVNKEFKR